MTEQVELDTARHEVLAENTGQAVHKHLDKLFEQEDRYRSRWIWELLQNARDASPKGGVTVWLLRRPKEIVFRHDGSAFTHKNIAHLIYHGSTKHDLIGQFGTGFLTTHLISRTVRVCGRTDAGKSFTFQLDRRGRTAEELTLAMDESWRAFVDSLTESNPDEMAEYTTEFSYPLDEGVASAVADGVKDLISNAAYMLAFNRQVRSLHVVHPEHSVEIRTREIHHIGGSALRFDIEELGGNCTPATRHVAVIGDGGTSAAVELIHSNARWSVLDDNSVPRIFVAFPLIATYDFCLPAIINDERFQPKEERDTLILKPNRNGKHSNMILMEQACDLAARLAMFAAAEDWQGAALLARLREVGQWDWLDSEWFRSLLAERFIQPLRRADILLTFGGSRISPCNGWIPVATDAAGCCDLWDAIVDLKDADKRLPIRSEAPLWSDTIRVWTGILSESLDHFAESMTLDVLCKRVSAWATVETVESHLGDSVNSSEWLNRLHALIAKDDRSELFDQLHLIPNQCGDLMKITGLRRDSGIDEQLKDIAEALGLYVRAELVDRRMRVAAIADLPPKTENDVLAGTIQKLKEKQKAGHVDADAKKLNVQLFVWLVRNDYLDELDGFPVFTRATTEETIGMATLRYSPEEPDDTLLAPVGRWPAAAQGVADLFPKRYTLSSDYSEELDDEAAWRRIEGKGLLRLSPLYVARRKVPFIPDEPLPESEAHQMVEPADVSALAFFEKDDMGLDSVRRSKTRAANLLLFLARHVLETDAEALATAEADCECGKKHRYFRSGWIVPMSQRKWIPLGDNKQSVATAEAILQLFDDRDDELRELTVGHGRSILAALKISLADLALRAVAKDEETRVSLIGSLADIVLAAGNDAERVRLIASEIKESPGILDQIGEQRKTREMIHRNQRVGREVERLLSQELAAHGMKVTRRPIGSDFEVENDSTAEDQEILLAVEDQTEKYLIEVKATLGNTVRMTITQAQTAFANRDRYALCVVTLSGPETTPEAVREGCRFVMDIGHRIEPALVQCLEYLNTKIKACTPTGDVELELTDTEIRFAVSADVYSAGLRLEGAVAQFSGGTTAAEQSAESLHQSDLAN